MADGEVKFTTQRSRVIVGQEIVSRTVASWHC